MILRTETLQMLKLLLCLSLLLLLTGMIWNLVTDQRSAAAMAVTLLGWMTAMASGAVLSTKRVLCPHCKRNWMPKRWFDKGKGRCSAC